jgi:hypothetical protein
MSKMKEKVLEDEGKLANLYNSYLGEKENSENVNNKIAALQSAVVVYVNNRIFEALAEKGQRNERDDKRSS